MLNLLSKEIKSLRLLLDKFCYGILAKHRPPVKTPEGSKILIDLFSRNKSISLIRAQKKIGKNNVENFIRLNLVNSIGDGKLKSSYIIDTINNFYFVFKKDESVYLGEDSHVFAKQLPVRSKFNKVLDLCTGSGIQAILMAGSAKKVTGVDLSSEAANAASFNVLLNGLEKKIKILQGDCYSPVKNMKFDLIISNPPYIPIPADIPYPLSGRGATDGMLVLRGILENMTNYLRKEGTGLIFGVTPGDTRRPKSSVLLEKISKRDGLDISLLILERVPKAVEIAGRASFIRKNYQGQELLSVIKKIENIYRKEKATHLYAYVIKIKKRKGDFKLIDLTKKKEEGRLRKAASLNRLYSQFEICFMKKQYYKAIVASKKILKIGSALGIKYRKNLNLALGVCYIRTGQFNKAIKTAFEFKKNNH